VTNDQIVVCAVLAGALALFAWGRLRHDVVAVLALLAVTLAGLVPPEGVFAGFGHPAVVTVAAVLVISRALESAGLVQAVAIRLAGVTESPLAHVFFLTLTVTVASAFMNNVGALALMLPVALSTSARRDRPPSAVLMPLAFGSILGGMTTLIGTPPNIIVAGFRRSAEGAPFEFFDFGWVGVPIALAGVAFITLIGWRLLPADRRGQSDSGPAFDVADYLIEVKVGEDSPLVGKRTEQIEELREANVAVVGRARGEGRVLGVGRRTLKAGDVLILRADADAVAEVLETLELEVVTKGGDALEHLRSEDLSLVEVVVRPGSPLVGNAAPALRWRTGDSIALLALARGGQNLRTRLDRISFEAGDILLLQGQAERLNDRLAELGLLPLAERSLDLLSPRRIGLALGVFAGAIALGVLDVMPIAAAFLLAIVVYVLLGILQPRDLYRPIDWPVIVLLGALIPVGGALESTGTTTLLAQLIVRSTFGAPAWVVLGLILIVTMFLSDLINNAATALIMAPIAISVAGRLDASADPFLMAVAVGASCAFLTPIGHQSNTLVMGPGGYRFTDYARMGLPLEILIVVLAVPLILWAWPL
jgi:di/tricarboxylate transporter